MTGARSHFKSSSDRRRGHPGTLSQTPGSAVESGKRKRGSLPFLLFVYRLRPVTLLRSSSFSCSSQPGWTTSADSADISPHCSCLISRQLCNSAANSKCVSTCLPQRISYMILVLSLCSKSIVKILQTEFLNLPRGKHLL